jgi:tetratricopeptide (TPR) repeat protein
MSHSISGEISSRASLKKALQSVCEAKDIECGVLRIESPEVSGSVGIRRGNQITGGIVDGKDETGLAAVAMLLGVQEGKFKYSADSDTFQSVDQSFKISVKSLMRELKTDSPASNEDTVKNPPSETSAEPSSEKENSETKAAPSKSDNGADPIAAPAEVQNDGVVDPAAAEAPLARSEESASGTESTKSDTAAGAVQKPASETTPPKLPSKGASALSKKWVAEQWLEENKKNAANDSQSKSANAPAQPSNLLKELDAIPTPTTAQIAHSAQPEDKAGRKPNAKSADSQTKEELKKQKSTLNPAALRGRAPVKSKGNQTALASAALAVSLLGIVGTIGALTYQRAQEGNAVRLLSNVRFALKYGLNDEALNGANSAIAACPSNAEAYVDRGLAYLALKRQQDALDDFNKALQMEPNNVIALRGRGQVFLARGMYTQSESDFKKAMSLATNDPDSYRMLAKLALAQHQDQKATQYSQEALKLAGSNATADDFEIVAQVHYDAHDYSHALANYQSALSKDPRRQTDLIHEAECYTKMGDSAKALAAYKRSIALDPTASISHLAVGQCYIEMKKYNLAINSFTDVLSREPNNLEALTNRAACFVALNQYGHAIEDFDAILKLTPNDKSIQNQRQTVLAKMSTIKHLAPATEEQVPVASSSAQLTELAQKVKTDEPGVVQTARQMMTNGDFETAVNVLAMCVRANPNDVNARHYLAVALSNAGQAAAAVQQFDLLLKIAKISNPDRLMYAKALASSGRLNDAIRQLRFLTMCQPHNDEFWIALVETYSNANMMDAAKLAARDAMPKVQTQSTKDRLNDLVNGGGGGGAATTNDANTPKIDYRTRS